MPEASFIQAWRFLLLTMGPFLSPIMTSANLKVTGDCPPLLLTTSSRDDLLLPSPSRGSAQICHDRPQSACPTPRSPSYITHNSPITLSVTPNHCIKSRPSVLSFLTWICTVFFMLMPPTLVGCVAAIVKHHIKVMCRKQGFTAHSFEDGSNMVVCRKEEFTSHSFEVGSSRSRC